jgi:hypothetical protein
MGLSLKCTGKKDVTSTNLDHLLPDRWLDRIPTTSGRLTRITAKNVS